MHIINDNYLSECNYLSALVLFWMSVISKAFVATLSMCLFAEKDIEQKLLLF